MNLLDVIRKKAYVFVCVPSHSVIINRMRYTALWYTVIIEEASTAAVKIESQDVILLLYGTSGRITLFSF